jgi:hypothetical protein
MELLCNLEALARRKRTWVLPADFLSVRMPDKALPRTSAERFNFHELLVLQRHQHRWKELRSPVAEFGSLGRLITP